MDLLLIHIVVFFNKKTEKKNTKQMRIEHSVQKKSWFLEREKNKKKTDRNIISGFRGGVYGHRGFGRATELNNLF